MLRFLPLCLPTNLNTRHSLSGQTMNTISRISGRSRTLTHWTAACFVSAAAAAVFAHNEARARPPAACENAGAAATSKVATKPLYPDLRPARCPSLQANDAEWATHFAQLQDELLRHNYRAMPDPATVMVPSHAIAGALLREHHIEAYRIYQHNTHQSSNSQGQPQVVGLVRVGTRVDGHEGIVHGGIIAMLVDDVLGYGFYSIGWPAAFTANLSLNYRAPVPAASILRIECYFERQERRKLYWKVRVVDARRPSILYVDATSLFVIPKHIYEQGRHNEYQGAASD